MSSDARVPSYLLPSKNMDVRPTARGELWLGQISEERDVRGEEEEEKATDG